MEVALSSEPELKNKRERRITVYFKIFLFIFFLDLFLVISIQQRIYLLNLVEVVGIPFTIPPGFTSFWAKQNKEAQAGEELD